MTREQALYELARREVDTMSIRDMAENIVECFVINMQGMSKEDLKTAFIDGYDEEITIED